METYPYSKLNDEGKAFADKYINSPFITFAKPCCDDFVRLTIEFADRCEEMIASGWLVIDNTQRS